MNYCVQAGVTACGDAGPRGQGWRPHAHRVSRRARSVLGQFVEEVGAWETQGC